MIAKIAVSAATFAIDKPYSYHVPEDLALEPGMRVTVPFGRGNRRSEGVVLTVEDGEDRNLKAVERSLDEEPVLSPYGLRLAAFLRERYFCTFYDAIRAMLPGGLWFKEQASVALTEDDSWKDAAIKKEGAIEILTHLEELGGRADEQALATVVEDEEKRQAAIRVLSHDPRPSYQRQPDRVYGLTFAGFDIRFSVKENMLTVQAVEKK